MKNERNVDTNSSVVPSVGRTESRPSVRATVFFYPSSLPQLLSMYIPLCFRTLPPHACVCFLSHFVASRSFPRHVFFTFFSSTHLLCWTRAYHTPLLHHHLVCCILKICSFVVCFSSSFFAHHAQPSCQHNLSPVRLLVLPASLLSFIDCIVAIS